MQSTLAVPSALCMYYHYLFMGVYGILIYRRKLFNPLVPGMQIYKNPPIYHRLSSNRLFCKEAIVCLGARD